MIKMELTAEEKAILAKAKKIEEATENVSPSEKTISKMETVPGDEKDLGSAGSVILANPRIANFTGRSLLDQKAGLVLDTSDDIELMKQKIAELEYLLKGGE